MNPGPKDNPNRWKKGCWGEFLIKSKWTKIWTWITVPHDPQLITHRCYMRGGPNFAPQLRMGWVRDNVLPKASDWEIKTHPYHSDLQLKPEHHNRIRERGRVYIHARTRKSKPHLWGGHGMYKAYAHCAWNQVFFGAYWPSKELLLQAIDHWILTGEADYCHSMRAATTKFPGNQIIRALNIQEFQ